MALVFSYPDAGEEEEDQVGGQRCEPGRLEVDELHLDRPNGILEIIII